MSLDYVEVNLDRHRKLKLGFKELRDLENRMGGIAFGDILAKLSSLSINTILQTLHVGFKGDDPRLTLSKLEDILDDYLNNGGSVGDLLSPITEALDISGVTGTRSKDEPERPTIEP